MSDRSHPAEFTVSDLARVSNLGLPLREILRHDDGNEFGRWILLYWSEDSKLGTLWIDFEVIEGIGCLVEKSERGIHVGGVGAGPVMFHATEDRDIFGVDGMTTDLDRAVWSARGFVKKSGCTQVYFPRGPLHHDDQTGLRGAFGAICRAQDRCYEIYDEADNCEFSEEQP